MHGRGMSLYGVQQFALLRVQETHNAICWAARDVFLVGALDRDDENKIQMALL